MPLAHFTVHEIPGTIAILLSGTALGLALARQTSGAARRAAFGLAALIGLAATIAAGADHSPLFAHIAAAIGGKEVIDAAWLGASIVLVGLFFGRSTGRMTRSRTNASRAQDRERTHARKRRFFFG